MKRIGLIIVAALLSCCLNAQDICMTTDRNTYVAGDNLWISIFTADTDAKTAYIELRSAQACCQCSKVALIDGRGGGLIRLLPSLPTGNYELSAYLKGVDNKEYKKNISVYNVLSTARGDEVVVTEETLSPASFEEKQAKGIEVSFKDGKLAVSNLGDEKALLAASIYDYDELETIPAEAVLISRGGDFHSEDFEGESVTLKFGCSSDISQLIGKQVTISFMGPDNDVYVANIDKNGMANIHTRNIYGKKDMFCEISDIPEDLMWSVEVVDPFKRKAASYIAPLQLSKDMADALRERSLAMQLDLKYSPDTIYRQLPMRANSFLSEPDITYILDDYTRFPTFSEIFIEYVSEVQSRKVDGKPQIRVLLRDFYKEYNYSRTPAMVIIDGVPVLDHQAVLDFDPLLVERLDIYNTSFSLGSAIAEGVIVLRTYKGDLGQKRFPSNVKVLQFDGCAVPLAVDEFGYDREQGDFRKTLYWNPAIELNSGETIEINLEKPSYKGNFVLKVDGICGNEPVSARYIL
ncbi:MAG: hypothetical protein HUJ93_02240 [Bacteroidales bacterium]|nr:hypothetical protein [Bacteroidales bacterium]